MEIIEMHSSWLAVNSIVGCTNGCKYCFLQSCNDNISKPRILVDAQESIEHLLASKYYNEIIPICLLPNTDPFLNENNIKYLEELLLNIKNKNIKNTITIVTKCLIPDDFINFIINEGFSDNLVVYLSYSGLGPTIEPNVSIENIKSNFVRLHKNNIKIIHYFRPMVPLNSNSDKIDEIIKFVNKYTDVSVITGLKLKENYIDKIDFWDDIKLSREESLLAEGVWPLDSYKYFYLNNNKHKFFQTNSCALAYKMKRPISQYYNTQECIKLNVCSKEQRKKCNLCKNESLVNIENKVIDELKKIKKYNNKVSIIINDDKVCIDNSDLTVGDLSYLSYMCGIKVVTNKRYNKEKYFNSSLNGSKPLIISNFKNNNLELFLKEHYLNAINLKKKFKVTEPKKWKMDTVCTELGIQIGHVLTIINNNSFEVEEKNRNIDNLGDELSDVLLQLCYLIYLNKININDIKIDTTIDDINLLPILFGQLSEAILEKEGYRYLKERNEYGGLDNYIFDKLCVMINIIYNFSIKNNLNMIHEFYIMLIDATMFLNYYVQENL